MKIFLILNLHNHLKHASIAETQRRIPIENSGNKKGFRSKHCPVVGYYAD